MQMLMLFKARCCSQFRSNLLYSWKLYLILAVIACFSRFLWEVLFPLSQEDFKGWIYFRDIVALCPAGILICISVYLYFLSPRPALQDFFLKYEAMSDKHWGKWVFTFSALGFLLCASTSYWVFHTKAQIVDEVNYIFQAKIFADGDLWAVPPPVGAKYFWIPYFIQEQDRWFSSFFPGQSALLALGERFSLAFLVNPLLVAMLVGITAWSGRILFSKTIGLIAALMCIASPFVLLQGGSYLSHIYPACVVTFVLTYLFAKKNASAPLSEVVVGLLTGSLLLFRPLSALVLGVFYLLFLMIGFFSKKNAEANRGIVRRILFFGIGNIPALLAFLIFNYAMTGNPLLTPHEVALPGEQLKWGVHSIKNTLINVMGLSVDLVGFPIISLIPIMLFFISKHPMARPLAGYTIFHLLAYGVYPYHGLSYGPRFYFDLAPLLLLVSSKSLFDIVPKLFHVDVGYVKSYSMSCVLASVVVVAVGILPSRFLLFESRGEYFDIENLVHKSVVGPAVVGVINEDTERNSAYYAAFQLNSANFLQSDILFVRWESELYKTIRSAFPDRRLYLMDVNKRVVEEFHGVQ